VLRKFLLIEYIQGENSMRYLLIFFILTLSGCLNIPFVPMVDNLKEQIHNQPIMASYQDMDQST